MNRLFAVILKNLRRLLHSRTSMLVIFLGPLILMLILGMAFNTNKLSGLTINVYSDENSDYATAIIENIEKGDLFTVEKTSREQCREQVLEGSAHLCMMFPGEEMIEFHIDYSRINLVFTLLDAVNNKLTQEGDLLGREIADQLFSQIQQTASLLEEQRPKIIALNTSLVGLNDQLITVQSQLLSIDFSVPSVDLNEQKEAASAGQENIAMGKEEFSEAIDTYQKRLSTTESTLDIASRELQSEKESRENVQEDLQNSYDLLSCSDETDLSSYFDNQSELERQLSLAQSPECATIYTMLVNVDESIEVIENTQEDLELMRDEVQSANEELDDLERDSDGFFSDSEEQLFNAQDKFSELDATLVTAQEEAETLRAKRDSLIVQLDTISQSVNSQKVFITNFVSTVDSVSESIRKATEISPESIVSPFDIKVHPLSSQRSNLEYLFPSLFILIIMFISVLLGLTMMNEERASRAHFRNFISPNNDWLFILGIFLTTLLLSFLQVFIISLLGVLFFDISILSVFFGFFIITLLATSIFSFIGILIGSLFSSDEVTTLTGIITCIIFFTFSGIVIPIEGMADIPQLLVQANPFYILQFLTQKLLIFDLFITNFPLQLLLLFSELALLLIAVHFAWRRLRNKT